MDEHLHPAQLPEHLIALPHSDWTLWRWVGLRGAGFPVAMVLQLASPAFAQKVDQFLEHEAQAEDLRQNLLQSLSREAQEIVGKQHWQLLDVLRRVKAGKLPALLPPGMQAETLAAMTAWKAACTRQESLWADLQTQFKATTGEMSQTLFEIASNEHFREAVTWQDRQAVHSGIDPFLQQQGNLSRKHREHSQLVAKYIQRYCAKNDTIGFFGPLGWARWVDGETSLIARPGAGLLASRTTYLETWCLDALGERLARDKTLLIWAVPRPMPFLSLDGTLLQVPFSRPVQLSPAQAAVFAACDGERTAKEIADTLLLSSLPGLASEADIFALLEELCAQRRIAWTFELPIEAWYPDQLFRRQLEKADDERARQSALALLERLEEAQAEVASAAGDAQHLDQALAHLEATFSELTGRDASREGGKTYAGRTLIYEDCRRDIEVELGTDLLEELGRPLALMSLIARWLTSTAAKLYQEAFQEAYAELARKASSTTVNFATFWSWIQPLLPADPAQGLIKTLIPLVQERWSTILVAPPGQRRVQYSSEQLRPQIEAIFAAPGPGWPSACYQSPDLLLAASGPDAVQRGAYEWVLGEFHVGLNTLDVIALVPQHPAPEALFEATAADLPAQRVVPALSKHMLPAKRTHNTLIHSGDLRLICGIDTCGIPAAQALRPGALVVEEVAGRLIARTKDGHQHFDLLELFDGLLSIQVTNSFKLFPPSSHTPRVTIDRLVIQRESWLFAPDELPFAFSKDALERYMGVRRWARTHELPRFIFVRTPVEMKPYYIDLDSPIYVEILTKAIRQAKLSTLEDGRISITEMLPSPEQSWLPDINNNRYTSEFRMVLVDQKKAALRSPTSAVKN
jgi:hypothetical protein